MAEYIEREKVKDELLSWAVCLNHPEHLLKEDALCVIDIIPAADVVEVVRCKDCRYWDDDRRCNGIKNGLVVEYTDEDDFCSYGERKDNG